MEQRHSYSAAAGRGRRWRTKTAAFGRDVRNAVVEYTPGIQLRINSPAVRRNLPVDEAFDLRETTTKKYSRMQKALKRIATARAIDCTADPAEYVFDGKLRIQAEFLERHLALSGKEAQEPLGFDPLSD